MNYIRLDIKATDEQQELLIGILSQFSPTGFEQMEDNLVVYFEEEHFDSYDVNAALKAYDFVLTNVKEENWNAVWESNFQPVVINNFCGIRAHFHEPLTHVQHEIIITPKMSFGTGHHATTYMMVDQMSELNFTNKSVFDFGTGTGVLAILAEKLGAKSVLAIDNDEWSIENAQENIDRNNCSKVELLLSPIVPDKQFDILLANINKNVLIQNVKALRNAANAGSVLLLSGLLVEDEGDIRKEYEPYGFEFVSCKNRSNWICLLIKIKADTVLI